MEDEPADEVLAAEMMLLPLLQDLKQIQAKKAFHHVDLSLQKCCVENSFDALENGNVCIGQYFEKSADGQPKPSAPVDMFAELRAFYELPYTGDDSFRQWDEIDKNHFRQAYRQVKDWTMQNAVLIVSTSNTLGGPDVRQHFGHEAKAIVTILEEASMEPEPNSWTFFGWNHLSKVKGFLLVGDPKQLDPIVPSTKSTPYYNEHGRQVGIGLMTRKTEQEIRSKKLTVQHRMHPDISQMPSEITYRMQLKNSPGEELDGR